MVDRSEPQIPVSEGVTRFQSSPGSSGVSMSAKRSGPIPAPAPGRTREATAAAA